MVTCDVARQRLLSVRVTVYVVVEDGLAVTGEPVDALRFADGVHVYVCAPLAVSVADCPLQIAGGSVTVITGRGLTVTVTCVEAVHPLLSSSVKGWVGVVERFRCSGDH